MIGMFLSDYCSNNESNLLLMNLSLIRDEP
jgi:hypothetical protein